MAKGLGLLVLLGLIVVGVIAVSRGGNTAEIAGAGEAEVEVEGTTEVASDDSDEDDSSDEDDADVADDALRLDLERRVTELARVASVPVYVVLDPRTGEELGRLNGSTVDAGEFAAFLQAAATRFDRSGKPATDTELWRRIFELEDEISAFTAAQPSGEQDTPASRR